MTFFVAVTESVVYIVLIVLTLFEVPTSLNMYPRQRQSRSKGKFESIFMSTKERSREVQSSREKISLRPNSWMLLEYYV